MFDGTQGLVDLSWEQWVPLIQLDDVYKDPLYNQYPYQEADDYDDDEEEMEIDDRMPGNARMPVWPPQLAPNVRIIVCQQVMPPTQTRLWVHPGVSTRIPIW